MLKLLANFAEAFSTGAGPAVLWLYFLALVAILVVVVAFTNGLGIFPRIRVISAHLALPLLDGAGNNNARYGWSRIWRPMWERGALAAAFLASTQFASAANFVHAKSFQPASYQILLDEIGFKSFSVFQDIYATNVRLPAAVTFWPEVNEIKGVEYQAKPELIWQRLKRNPFRSDCKRSFFARNHIGYWRKPGTDLAQMPPIESFSTIFYGLIRARDIQLCCTTNIHRGRSSKIGECAIQLQKNISIGYSWCDQSVYFPAKPWALIGYDRLFCGPICSSCLAGSRIRHRDRGLHVGGLLGGRLCDVYKLAFASEIKTGRGDAQSDGGKRQYASKYHQPKSVIGKFGIWPFVAGFSGAAILFGLFVVWLMERYGCLKWSEDRGAEGKPHDGAEH